jgi:hypothetical protein
MHQAAGSTRPVPRPDASVPGAAGAMRSVQAPSRGGEVSASVIWQTVRGSEDGIVTISR